MITTAYWPEADSGENLRRELLEHVDIEEIVHFSDYTVFDEAKGQQNLIYRCRKRDEDTIRFAYLKSSGRVSDETPESLLETQELFHSTSYDADEFTLPDDGSPWYGIKGLSKGPVRLDVDSQTVGDYFESKQGTVPNPDTVTSRSYDSFENEDLAVGEGVFLLADADLERSGIDKSHSLLRNAYRNSDISEFHIDYTEDLYLLYITSQDDVEDYPKIKNHLQRYKKKLEKRREVEQGGIDWYSLHWPRNPDLFESSKIVYSNWGNDWQPYAIEDSGYYERRDITILKPVSEEVNLHSVIALLNSSLSQYRQTETLSRTGYSTQDSVEQMPLPSEAVEHQELSDLARSLEETQQKRTEERHGFLAWVEREWEVNIEKLSRKTFLKEYWKYDFDSDKGILQIAKDNSSSIDIDPTSRQFQEQLETEWRDSVETIRTLSGEFDEKKNQIDQIIYQIYGLTDEEIEIVEEAIGDD